MGTQSNQQIVMPSVASVLIVALAGVSALAPCTVRNAMRVPTLPRASRLAIMQQEANALAETDPELPATPLAVPMPPVETVEPEAEKDGVFEALKTGSFFALWYLFNVVNQIYNKQALNALGIPYTIATLQLFVGIPYCALLWTSGLRK